MFFAIWYTLWIIYIIHQSRAALWKGERAIYAVISLSIPTGRRLHACWHPLSLPPLPAPATCPLWRCLQRSHGNGSCDQSAGRRAPGNSGRSWCCQNQIVFRVTSRSVRRGLLLPRRWQLGNSDHGESTSRSTYFVSTARILPANL